MELSKKEHWENVFATKQENEVSWFQRKPEASLLFFKENNIPKNSRIIDVGGGDSYLIDHLLDMGYTNLYLLDIAEKAIEKIKNRLGQKAKNVTFIVADILDFKPNISFDVWHDRASFHFLTTEEDILKYVTVVTNSVNVNGHLFIGTFSENGPLKCSGLKISQYNAHKLEHIFEKDFKKLYCFNENHKTPFDTEQNFIFCTFKKNLEV